MRLEIRSASTLKLPAERVHVLAELVLRCALGDVARSGPVKLMTLDSLRCALAAQAGSAFRGAAVLSATLLLSTGCSGQLVGDEASGSASEDGSDNRPGDPASDGTPPGVDGIGWTTRYPRLSHLQWENSVRDLLGLTGPLGLAESFALDPDDAAFDTYVARTVSANLWNDYQRAAESVAATAVASGALGVIDDPEAFVRTLGGRAFRRPLSDAEVTSYLALFEQGAELLGRGSASESGVELVLRAFLQSPHFLYRVETSTAAAGDRIWLSGYEVASRLSYALWNTMPSDELLAAAGSGELDSAEGVERWSRRMLDDARAAEVLMSFHAQFFHVSGYGTIAKNPTLFPTFTLELKPVLEEEARLYVREVTVLGDGGIAELLTTPIAFVNETTAPFYGVSGSFGPALERVDLDPAQRAGILTQVGFLSKYASQTQSDPILRGVHTSLDVLCTDLPPPPNDIPPLPPLGEGQTNRERVEVSTSVVPCSGCHEPFINPLGFAFENYDAVGSWRDTDNGRPVDASASYEVDGELVSYQNAVELSQLLSQSNALHHCYSKNWLEYVLGRRPSAEEKEVLEGLAQVSNGGSGMRDLLAKITTLDTFRARPQESGSL